MMVLVTIDDVDCYCDGYDFHDDDDDDDDDKNAITMIVMI
jgi:hypothetical protein